MKIAVIAFSVCGAELAERLIAALMRQGESCAGYIAARHAENTGFTPFSSVYDIAARLFFAVDALIFVGACGIAVRAVAPLLQSKLRDPAVVVCDETGRVAISLLSGHAGGANALSERVAAIIGACPVITTASDCHAFADGVEQPRNLVLGIGCRRGLRAEAVERAVTMLLWDARLPLSRVCAAATIDIKRDDAALLGFVRAHQLPLYFYTAAELAAVPGEFSASPRVLAAVNVDNVCERAAARCGGQGRFLLRKTARDGVAVAVFLSDVTLDRS